MAATRASGTTAVRYGTMRENVLSLTVVLPDGRVIRPFAISAATCSFPSVEAAVNTAIQTIQAGIPIARIELADAAAMNSIIRYSKLDLPVAPILWMEFHGTENAVAEQAKMVQRIAADHGGTHFAWATKPEDRRKLWQARHDAHYAAKATRPGVEAWVTDVCVPISRLAECISETQNDIAASFLRAGILGHAGDGNFHVGFMLNPNEPREMAEAKRLNERLVYRALALDGTCTGRHARRARTRFCTRTRGFLTLAAPRFVVGECLRK
jgi:D-lactate dehydrogenase (cytochrome)